jgi:hypothetical protein
MRNVLSWDGKKRSVVDCGRIGDNVDFIFGDALEVCTD